MEAQIDIPLVGSLTINKNRGNLKHGRWAGMHQTLKSLKLGGNVDVPVLWLSQLGRVAKTVGIHVVTRKIGNGEMVRVFRDK